MVPRSYSCCISQCFDVLMAQSSHSLSRSLLFPVSCAHVAIYSLIKKPSLCHDGTSNYRRIVFLRFIKNILEKIVAISSELSVIGLCLHRQITYRKPLTAFFLTFHHHIISSTDKGQVTAIILNDLRTDFDTVDHDILLHLLGHCLVFWL